MNTEYIMHIIQLKLTNAVHRQRCNGKRKMESTDDVVVCVSV